MIRVIALLLMSLGFLEATLTSLRADDFELTITVDPDNRPVSSKKGGDVVAPPDAKVDHSVSTKQTLETLSRDEPPPRPVVKLKRDTPAGVSWHSANTSPSETFKNVLVHFFVVKEKKVGDREVPELTEDVTYEGALTTDFAPKGDANWHWTLNIHEPGSYLLRVETVGMDKTHGHDHYAAMDLNVE